MKPQKTERVKVCPNCGLPFLKRALLLNMLTATRFRCRHCGTMSKYDSTPYSLLLYWSAFLLILMGSVVILENYAMTSTPSDNSLLESLFVLLVIVSGIAAAVRITIHCRNHRRLIIISEEKTLPYHRAEWVIPTAWLLNLSAIVLIDLIPFNLLESSDLQYRWFYLITNIRFYSLMVALSAMMIIGLRTLRKVRFRRRRAYIMPVFAAIFFTGMIIFNWWFSGVMGHLNTILFSEENQHSIVERLKDPTLDPKSRSFLSKSIAAERYFETGECIDYITEDGTLKQYVPDESARKMKREIEIFQQMFLSVRLSDYISLTAFILSIGIGLLTPIRNRLNRNSP